MGWLVKTKPGKLVVRHPSVPDTLVVKIRREVDLIPRWKISSAQTTAAFFSATALAHDGYVAGGILGVLALFLTWAAGR
jgi:hypothetical protein